MSINWVVMLAWRALLYTRDRLPTISSQFYVALSMADMRAACSLAEVSSSPRYI